VKDEPLAIEGLAEKIGIALQSADLDAYRELLDPAVSWGPPGDQLSGCHSRDEVLDWYRRGHASGVRADVVETVVSRDKILVGLKVRSRPGTPESGGELDRWQVLTVVDGRVKDIRGFEDRGAAVAGMK
jgi:hypothetical protein